MSQESSSRSAERPPYPAPHRFEQFIAKRHRIFVNRNLRLAGIRWIGFDMDHTLALYNSNFIEALAFDLAKEALIVDRGYPEALREIRYDPDFGIRGLVVDKAEGHILKMDRFHYVAEAFHGRAPVSKARRKELYTGSALKLSSDRFWSNDTLFGLPEISLYAGVVEALADEDGGTDYRQLFDDIRHSVDRVHRDGSLKRIILGRLDECFLRDPKLPSTLDKFRREGKKLFLLTNSDAEYTAAVLDHVLQDPFLDRPWWAYFDLIVCGAGKPGFFQESGSWRPSPISPAAGPPAFTGGDVQLLEQQLGARGDEILYIGDHIYGDILRSKKSSGWRTVMVVEELEHEIRASEESGEDNARIDALQMENEGILDRLAAVRAELETLRREKLARYRSLPEDELGALDDRLAGLGATESELDRELTDNLLAIRDIEEEIRRRYNPYWGPLCKVDGELSRFGNQMEDFACLYTSRVSNFLFYPPDKYFRSPEEFLPHEI